MEHRIIASIGLALLMLLGFAGGASAADKVKAVASFSILGDMVKQVGGDRVDVITLVGPNGDAHVYQPTPADAKNLAAAQILFTNGLGFEGWMDRLEKSSGFKGTVVVASTGVKPRTMVEDAKTITDPPCLAEPRQRQTLRHQYPRRADRRRSGRQVVLRSEYSQISRRNRQGRIRREGGARRAPARSAQDHHEPRRLRLFRCGLRARDHRP